MVKSRASYLAQATFYPLGKGETSGGTHFGGFEGVFYALPLDQAPRGVK